VLANRAERQLARLVRTQAAALGGDLITVALETPGQLLDLWPTLEAQLDDLDEPALAAIDAALPMYPLMELSLSVATRLADAARKSGAGAAAATDVPPELQEKLLALLASRVDTLVIRLSNVGRREEAWSAAKEVVDIRRGLAKRRPEAYVPGLARRLNHLWLMLLELGRRDEAFTASQEAVDIYRRLAQTRADASLAHLVSSLKNLGNNLAWFDRHENALATSQEAVDTSRILVQRRPVALSAKSRRESE